MQERNTVLIVDDEEIIKLTLKDVLKKEYTVLCASNGQEALDILNKKASEIGVIVLDIVMPVMDGLSFLEEFHNHQEYTGIPIIVATATEDEELEHKCLELGVWDFVMKPYNPDLLQYRVRNAMERSKMIMAELDSVTGCYTKIKFYQTVRELLTEYKDEQFAFVRFDIDRFKMINNFYGFKEGDKVLRNIALELRKVASTFDKFIYGRLENDVFACCMPYKEENVDLLVNALKIKLKKVNKDYNIKVSFGVYIIDDYKMDVSEMYDRASLAAKSCKGKYMENVAYYNTSMIENMRHEQSVINEVNRALEEEQFKVYLQPKINLMTGRPYGAEALVRWKHPEKGMISPAEFIPIYERNGIIGRLDQYMWRHVCILLRKWLDEGRNPDPISVNVSRVNIYNPHLVEIFKKLIAQYQIPAHLLNLELTESAFMEDQDLVMKTMSKLHQNGFQIMMDDFGSGYSSLNVLKDMEVDYLKIDMKFLREEEFNGKGEKVLTSVIRMAKWLHMPSIVEGVETAEQVDFLKCIGCEYAQGFYFAQPMPVEDYEHYIEHELNKEAQTELGQSMSMMSDLWNTRSNASQLLELLDVPIAIYEFCRDKLELLRTNQAYERIINSEEIDEEEAEMLKEMFEDSVNEERVIKKEYCKEYGRWYLLQVKEMSKSNDTHVMLVTFIDISEYKN